MGLRGVAAVVVGALLLFGLVGCATRAPARMTVSPASARIDEPVTVSVIGLTPGTRVVLSARSTDAEHVVWRSSADFVVPASGVVRTTDRSVGGSYIGVDGMGLFTLLAHAGTSDPVLVQPASGLRIAVRAGVAGVTVASTTVDRRSPDQVGVTRTRYSVAKDGVDGELFDPAATTKRPGVLLLGGSEGGLSQAFSASTLAAEGYPTLTVAYFKDTGVPSTLRDVPLEYFVRAAKLLRADPRVDPSRLVVWGISRGSEAALLTAADFPGLFAGVIAGVPNDRIAPSYPGGASAAWTLHGEPLAGQIDDDPDPADTPATFLPVARLRVPLLTICGGQDQEVEFVRARGGDRFGAERAPASRRMTSRCGTPTPGMSGRDRRSVCERRSRPARWIRSG